MATPIETRTVRVWRCKCEHGYVRCSRDVNHQGDICSDCTPPRVHVNGYHTTALESTPSVDADYPPAPQPSANESLLLMRLIDRRKADNVNQAIEFLNAAGRRAGDR